MGRNFPHRVDVPVDYVAGEEVGEAAPEASDEEQRPRRGRGDAGDVGVVDQHEHRHHLEREVVADLARGVAEVLAPTELRRRVGARSVKAAAASAAAACAPPPSAAALG